MKPRSTSSPAAERDPSRLTLLTAVTTSLVSDRQPQDPAPSVAAATAAEPPPPPRERPVVPPRPNLTAKKIASQDQAAERSDGVAPLKAAPCCSEATLRKSKMMQVYILDHYIDLFTYLDKRKRRTAALKEEIANGNLSPTEKSALLQTHHQTETAHLRARRTRLRLPAFEILEQVGQGGYGQVFLARKRDTRELCAVKRSSKRQLVRTGELQHALTERDVLTRTEGAAWLVRLLYAFQDVDFVYLAMEYVPGGDMRTLLNNSGVLREDHARFYIAEMFVAIAELHRLGYIHRDLKPENYLIDAAGHLKLTDFGLSRGKVSDEIVDKLKNRLEKVKDSPYTYRSTRERRDLYKSVRREEMRGYTQVGSPDYMAPEVLTLSGRGYNLSVDYWSLGCILFECLAGFPPFTAPTSDEVWVNVYHWHRVLERPVYTGDDEEFNFTDVGWDLVTKLITHPPSRLTTLASVQLHPFFHMYPFTALRTPTGPTPPFVPQLKSPTDTTYFDDFSNEKDMAMYHEVQQRQAAMDLKVKEMGDGGRAEVEEVRRAFVGYTFRHREAKRFGGVGGGPGGGDDGK